MASQPIRRKVKRALDSRAESMFGAGSVGLYYVLYWIADRRSMVGLAHAIGSDFGRPTLSRECLGSVIRRYPGSKEQIASARRQLAARQAEYERAAGLAEAPPAPNVPALRPVVAGHTGPLTLDHLRRARYTGSTSALQQGR